MTNQDMAIAYLNAFCAGDIDALQPLLADDLSLRGPLHSFKSASAYLESLRSDPPRRSAYRILSITEGRESVALFYEYLKPDRMLPIAQLFRFDQCKICDILLIFDTTGFA